MYTFVSGQHKKDAGEGGQAREARSLHDHHQEFLQRPL